MGWMAGVLDDPPGFPYTPPGVDVLEGGKLTSNNVAGSSHDPLQSFAVASGAISKPGGDAAGQDALHSAGVHIIGNHNTGLCDVCLIEETVEHVLKKCKAYKKERRILKEELQAVGCQEFTITSLLNDGPNSGKQIKAVIRFIKNSGLYNRI